MRKTSTAIVPMLALLIGGLAANFTLIPAGAMAVSDSEVANVYGGQQAIPICGTPNPIACGGSTAPCTYTPCINIVCTGQKTLGTVMQCTSDGSVNSSCGSVNLSATCLNSTTVSTD